MLSGLLIDLVTGEPMVARGGRGRHGGYYRYYGPKRGPGRRLRADEIERAVWEAVASVVFAGPAVEQARTWVEGGAEAEVDELEQRLVDLRHRAAGLRASADNLVAAIAQGVDGRTVSGRLASIEAELAQVGEDSIAAEIELAMQPETIDLDGGAEDWCRALRAAYEDDDILRAQFLRRIISRIDVPAEGPLVVHHSLITPGRTIAPPLGSGHEGRGSHDVLEWLPD